MTATILIPTNSAYIEAARRLMEKGEITLMQFGEILRRSRERGE